MKDITPFFWFDTNAEEAVNYYVEVFPESKITSVTRYGEGMPIAAGTVMTMGFQLLGQDFIALNGGPHFTFSPAVSFLVQCETQEEIDKLWNHFLAGGETMQCGWIRDKFGMTWQVVPTVLFALLNDPDPEKAERVLHAMLQMVKMDIATLQNA